MITSTHFHTVIALVFLVFPHHAISGERSNMPDTCTYTVSIWNSEMGAVSRTERVEKNYYEVTREERDPSGTSCTVCSEDQVRIELPGLPPFYACYEIADRIEAALHDLMDQGEPILSVSGYRPIRSKGVLNSDGERTELSNHAFGVAIDINRMQNGLYNDCYEWNPGCRLALGGPWRPGGIEGSLNPNGAIVRKMKALGFEWGGEIEGSQKDFMHFSFSGY